MLGDHPGPTTVRTVWASPPQQRANRGHHWDCGELLKAARCPLLVSLNEATQKTAQLRGMPEIMSSRCLELVMVRANGDL